MSEQAVREQEEESDEVSAARLNVIKVLKAWAEKFVGKSMRATVYGSYHGRKFIINRYSLSAKLNGANFYCGERPIDYRKCCTHEFLRFRRELERAVEEAAKNG